MTSVTYSWDRDADPSGHWPWLLEYESRRPQTQSARITTTTRNNEAFTYSGVCVGSQREFCCFCKRLAYGHHRNHVSVSWRAETDAPIVGELHNREMAVMVFSGVLYEQVKEVLIFRWVGHEISSSALKRRTPLGCIELARPMFKPLASDHSILAPPSIDRRPPKKVSLHKDYERIRGREATLRRAVFEHLRWRGAPIPLRSILPMVAHEGRLKPPRSISSKRGAAAQKG